MNWCEKLKTQLWKVYLDFSPNSIFFVRHQSQSQNILYTLQQMVMVVEEW